MNPLTPYRRDPKSGLLLPEPLVGKNLRLLHRGRFAVPPARFRNPVLAGVEDVVNQPIYDSFSVASGTAWPNVTTLFAQSMGQSGKTLAQTNMIAAGILQAPQRLFVQSYRVFIGNDTTIADMNSILRNVSVTLTIGKKPYFEGPVWLLTAGAGALVTAAAQVGTAPTGSAPLFSTSNGSPDQRNVFSLSKPFMLEEGESFSVTFRAETAFNTQANTTNPAGVGATVYFVLDGELYRGVQ
jgi:hypothetical protein